MDAFPGPSVSLDDDPFSGLDDISQIDTLFFQGFPGIDVPDFTKLNYTGSEVSPPLEPDETNVRFPQVCNSRLSRPPSASFDGHSPQLSDTDVSEASESACSCLTLIFVTLKKLSMSKSPTSARCSAFDDFLPNEIAFNGSNKTQEIVVNNRQIIRTVSAMLQCSCAKDCYVLTLLSMIVMKILGSYEAAAPRLLVQAEKISFKPARTDNMPALSSQLGSRSDRDEEANRLVAQTILSELHRVQRLINELSPRLTTGEKSTSSEDSSYQARNVEYWYSSEQGTISPLFSTTTLQAIEKDIRMSLRNFSTAIISILQET